MVSDEARAQTSGPFRGRWWSHYERGRSYLNGGYQEEAAADFKTALALRAEDQRWARTYGLHFLPEYFPNRELGIVRYNEGHLDEAASLLQRSLTQERTALAAHYLELVRAKQVSDAGGDTIPPQIHAEAVGSGAGVVLKIRVEDNSFVATLSVNQEPQQIEQVSPQVNVETSLPLVSGINQIVISATDIAGNSVEKTLEIDRDLDGPVLAIEAVDSGAISGTVFDPSGIREFRIEARPVAGEPLSNGGIRFHATASSGAPFLVVDTLGNETTGRLPSTPGTHAEAHRICVAANVEPAFLGKIIAQTTEESTVRLSNLAEGQRYLMDEIVVAIEADDPQGIKEIALDGAPLTGILPGARTQFLSRRIRLDKIGTHTVHASMTNSKGDIRDAHVAIERVPTDIERPEERLRVALLGNLWEGAGARLENEAAFVAEELTGAMFKRGRVDVVSRDALPRVLEEQELRTVLGSRDLAPGLRQIVPADLLVVGKVRRTGDIMEIVLQAVSSETSHILGYADVAGAVSSLEDLRALVRDLAIRFEQEFPRVSGLVASVQSGERCFATLTTADRVRPELPCIVYRFGDPILHPGTGAVLGRQTEIIARGALDEVRRQMSRVTYQATTPVQVNDHVATR